MDTPILRKGSTLCLVKVKRVASDRLHRKPSWCLSLGVWKFWGFIRTTGSNLHTVSWGLTEVSFGSTNVVFWFCQPEVQAETSMFRDTSEHETRICLGNPWLDKFEPLVLVKRKWETAPNHPNQPPNPKTTNKWDTDTLGAGVSTPTARAAENGLSLRHLGWQDVRQLLTKVLTKFAFQQKIRSDSVFNQVNPQIPGRIAWWLFSGSHGNGPTMALLGEPKLPM